MSQTLNPSPIPSLQSAKLRTQIGMAETVGEQADASGGEAVWQGQSALALTPGPKAKRVERVSVAYKEALSKFAAETPCIQGTSQVLAVQSGLAQVTESSAPRYHPKNSQSIRFHTMYQYWQACRSATAGLDRWHSSLDGVTVSGEHTVPFLHYTPQTKLLSFGAPQVPQNTDLQSNGTRFTYN
jgi:hypothetical protein